MSTTVTDTGLASTAFILLGSASIFLMTPGLALFYSGLAGSKNAMSLILICMLTFSVVVIQWFLIGYSLAFSDSSSSSFIGDLKYGGFNTIEGQANTVAPQISAVLFSSNQMMASAVTCAIIYGSAAERIRILPAMVFAFLWTTLVYDVVAYWTWGYRGWLRNLSCLNASTPCGVGVLDFAGGGPVHMAAGFSALAYCLVVGKRKRESRPSSVYNVFLGTGLLWFGWIFFNAGAGSAANTRSAMAGYVTTLSGATGSLVWTLIDYIKTKKFSILSYCNGALAGLVLITPGCGFVTPWAALVIGFLGGSLIYYSVKIKHIFRFDDTLDAWGFHGFGGVVGTLLVGIFASPAMASLDGATISGGWIYSNWIQMGYQLAAVGSITTYAFTVSYFVLKIMNYIPGLRIRCDELSEEKGQDAEDLGEAMYAFLESHPKDARVEPLIIQSVCTE